MKQIVPDRAFVYDENDKDCCKVAGAFLDAGCIAYNYSFPISAENLCKYFAETLQNILDTREPGIRILDLKLREDNNSYVSWKWE